MLARKQKTYSILADEIDEDNIVFEHKSVDAFEQDNFTTMALGTWGSSFLIWGPGVVWAV